MTGGNAAPARTRKVVVVSPHFPPSNLAAVHRARLFARHLPSFGWEPIVVTVHHRFYEEKLDWKLAELVGGDVRVERVGAIPVRPLRVVGDIGVRGFWQMYRRIVELVKRERVDFVYILIPSHYAALLGALVHARTGTPYGIDYIDPWVHRWPGTDKLFSRHWWSCKLAEWLEPVAVRRASLITGVAPGYYAGVFERNPHLSGRVHAAAMPYGGERYDHEFVRRSAIAPYLFAKKPGVIDLVYAGAMLPNAYAPLERILGAIARDRAAYADVRLHFIGTGTAPDKAGGYNIRPRAEAFGLYGGIIHEYPARIPYLDVLTHLEAADGVFILGSTDPHYTPSKVYQGVLSGKPIFAVLHEASSAARVISETQAGVVLAFAGADDVDRIGREFPEAMKRYRAFMQRFDPAALDTAAFEAYSARAVTRALAQALDRAVP